ncbi:MAG TPA: OmpA family protein [Candidatus Kryptonia bacterium]|nr:OmpA family protein [Candidatus Kryptonia bacterium]
MMRKIGVCLLTVLSSVTLARSVGASATLTGETGLVMVPTTDVLDPLHVRVGVYGDGEIETDPKVGNRDLDRIDFSIGLGLIKNLEVYSHIPVVFFSRDLAGNEETTSNGGLRLGFKYRLLDEANGAPLSAALLADVVIGIGNDSLPAIMDRSTAFGRRETYEVMGIFDRSLWKMPCGDLAVLTLNAGGLFFDQPKASRYSIDNQGTEFRRRFTGPNTTFDTPFEFAAAANTPLLRGAQGKLAWSTEFRGNTGIVQELRGAIPMQLFTGFRWALPESTGLALSGGIDFGLSGVLDGYRYVAGMTWQTPPAKPPARVVAQVPPPPPPPAPPVKRKIVLRGVHFDYDKANIRADSEPILKEAAATLNENRDIAVVVEGHTDSRGSDAYNDKLSLRRATAVRDYLAKLGVAADRMSVGGKGEREPVADNKTDEGRAQNRRVELLVK